MGLVGDRALMAMLELRLRAGIRVRYEPPALSFRRRLPAPSRYTPAFRVLDRARTFQTLPDMPVDGKVLAMRDTMRQNDSLRVCRTRQG